MERRYNVRTFLSTVATDSDRIPYLTSDSKWKETYVTAAKCVPQLTFSSGQLALGRPRRMQRRKDKRKLVPQESETSLMWYATLPHQATEATRHP